MKILRRRCVISKHDPLDVLTLALIAVVAGAVAGMFLVEYVPALSGWADLGVGTSIAVVIMLAFVRTEGGPPDAMG